MVSVSGIRGRVGAGLTPEVVTSYAAAFGAWATAADSSKPVVVGRDSRVSGPMFHRSVVSALQSVGVRVIDLGLTTTPTCQLAVEHHHAAGGLMISASHNPIEWNALKFVGSDRPVSRRGRRSRYASARRAAIPSRDLGAARHRRGRRRSAGCGISRPCWRSRDRHGAHSREKASRRARLLPRRRGGHHAGAARAARLRGDGDQPGA